MPGASIDHEEPLSMEGMMIKRSFDALGSAKSMESVASSQMSQSMSASKTVSSSSHYSSSSSFSSSSMSQSMTQSSNSLLSNQSSLSQGSLMSQSAHAEQSATMIAASESHSAHSESSSVKMVAAVSTPALTSSSVEKKIIGETRTVTSPVVTVTGPRMIVTETIHMSVLSDEYRSSQSHSSRSWEEAALVTDNDDGILYVRQFDLAPSPVKEILLFTSVTTEPPVDMALAFMEKKIHLASASLITIEKGELKLIREEVEEDEGMFEEYWEEVITQQYEEEQRKSQHRRMMMEERIEETRRTQEKRQQLLKRIEETKGIYSYGRGYERHYSVEGSIRSSLHSPYSPYSYRSESPLSVRSGN